MKWILLASSMLLLSAEDSASILKRSDEAQKWNDERAKHLICDTRQRPRRITEGVEVDVLAGWCVSVRCRAAPS